MDRKKPTLILATGAVACITMLAPTYGATAAQPGIEAPQPASLSATADATADELSQVKAYVADTPVTGFNPLDDGEYDIPADGTPRLAGIPAGWLVTRTPIQHGRQTLTLTNRTRTVTYTFIGPDADAVQELRHVAAHVDGKPVTGFIPTTSGTYTIPKTGRLTLTGIPGTWHALHRQDNPVWTLTGPDGHTVTYTFNRAGHKPTLSDLKNLTVLYPTGSKVKDFDPTKPGDYQIIGDTTSLTFQGLPGDWTYQSLPDRMGWEFTGPDGHPKATYTFTPEPRAKNTHTIVFDLDSGTGDYRQVSVQDGHPVTRPATPDQPDTTLRFDGWYRQNQRWDFNQPVTQDMTLTAQWASTPADGTGQPDPTQPLHGDADGDGRYTVDDLKDVTATVDGKPFDRFDYRTTDYQTDSLDVRLEHLPDGWTYTKVDNPTIGPEPPVVEQRVTVGVHAPDGSLVQGYGFNIAITPLPPDQPSITPGQPAKKGDMDKDGKYTVDDLKSMTVSIDGQPFDRFDPDTREYTLDQSKTIKPDRLPDGWTADTQSTPDGETTITIHDPDGNTPIIYTFTVKTNPSPDKPDPTLKGDANQDGKYTADDLKNATIPDTTGFDPTKPGDYQTDGDPATVRLDHLPDGWTQTTDGHGALTVTSPDGKTIIKYTFHKTSPGANTPDKKHDVETTDTTGRYTLDGLKGLTAAMNGKPINGFDYRTDTYQVDDPHAVTLDNQPKGWKTTVTSDAPSANMTVSPYMRFTLTSPDGLFTATYTFTKNATTVATVKEEKETAKPKRNPLSTTGSDVTATTVAGTILLAVGILILILNHHGRHRDGD